MDDFFIPEEGETSPVLVGFQSSNCLLKDKGQVKKEDIHSFRWTSKTVSQDTKLLPKFTFGTAEEKDGVKLDKPKFNASDSNMLCVKLEALLLESPQKENRRKCKKKKFSEFKRHQSSSDIMAELLK